MSSVAAESAGGARTAAGRGAARPTFGGSSWRDQLKDQPAAAKKQPSRTSSSLAAHDEDFPTVAPGLVQQRRNVPAVHTSSAAPRPEPTTTSVWGSRPMAVKPSTTGAEQHEEALYGRDATTTVRPAGVRPLKTASRQPLRPGLARAPIHGGGFPQWTEVRFRPSDEASEVPADIHLTREPQALEELHRDGGEIVNGLVRDYKEDRVDPSATKLKIAELQDWDEDRLMGGAKLMSQGISLKKAAREAGVLTGALKEYYEHHFDQDTDDDDY